MKVELEIEDYWIARAKRVPGSMALQAMVTLAFREFVQRYELRDPAPDTGSKLDALLALAGKVEFFEGYDPEAEFGGARPPLTEEEKKSW